MARHKVKDELLNHDYDGIREYDNDLPPWWLWLFYVTIAIAVVYLFHYHLLGTGDVDAGTLKASTISDGVMYNYQSPWEGTAPVATSAPAPASTSAEKQPTPSQDEEIPRITEPARLDHGAQVFAKNCVPCHGDKGQGVIGPNLTDDYWIHGGTMTEVVKVITYGVPAKGMIPWGGTLSRDDILDVAGFVLERLHGTNPPNAKPPQGVKVTS